MPSMTLRHEFDCDEDTYWYKMFLNEEFNRQLYLEYLKFPGWKLLDQNDDGATITRRMQVDPPTSNLPGPLKKLIGSRLSYIEDGRFDKASKKWSFKVIPNTLVEKTTIRGDMVLEKIGDKKVRRLFNASVEVKVFMVGGMAEDRIMSDMRSSYEKSVFFTNDYIAANGL
ncbi:MAG: DUF2505 domain-containing protein [Polyangiaceae bacterium]|nr:DUF2505 domain-containing protein [Polyangiaceae bacterium]